MKKRKNKKDIRKKNQRLERMIAKKQVSNKKKERKEGRNNERQKERLAQEKEGVGEMLKDKRKRKRIDRN